MTEVVAVNPRRKNYLKKVLAVQDCYQEVKEDGLPDTLIHRKYISPKFYISIRTFRRYLEVNAKRELRIIEEQLNVNKNE